jgi:hypothetical protein
LGLIFGNSIAPKFTILYDLSTLLDNGIEEQGILCRPLADKEDDDNIREIFNNIFQG